MIIAMFLMTFIYIAVIFLCGVCTNWQAVLSGKKVDLANVEYVLINNMGLVTAQKLGSLMQSASCWARPLLALRH